MHRRTLLRQLGASGAVLAAAAVVAARRNVFDVPRLQPALAGGVALNQLGFLPGGAKTAVLLASRARRDPRFRIVSAADSSTHFEGKLTDPEVDAHSGDRLQQARFSEFRAPGTFHLEAEGLQSEPFLIAPDAYAHALRLTMRSYYGQRCGCAVDLGGGYRHPACHMSGAYHATSGRSGTLRNRGGWHDAGDYGRYVVNSGITTGTLLWAWEFYGDTLHGLSLDIPESGGMLPDFLAEIKWNLAWMLSLQDADGGVWQKQTSEQFCSFIMPEQDHMTSYVIGTGAKPYKSTCATADLASVAAIAARCFRPFDAVFADRCLSAARRAWKWAIAHPSVTFRNPNSIGTGAYADPDCSDELMWASAELWRNTGEQQFERAFLHGFESRAPDAIIQGPSWSSVGSMAYWTYALAGHGGKPEVIGWVHEQTRAAVTRLITQSEANGYGNTLSADAYAWGSNSTAGNHSLLLLVADHLEHNPRAVEVAFGNLDYLLGRNCFGISWVTQLGTRPFAHPHHRPSAADGIAAPWPGLLSGGPNALPGDNVARSLPKMPPMRMWVDDQRAYSMNEVAINWNAPLVFLLAAANARAS